VMLPVNLNPAQIAALREASTEQDTLAIVAATLPREADALTKVDLPGLARTVSQPGWTWTRSGRYRTASGCRGTAPLPSPT
jgi:hypothetical protein